MVSRRDCQGIGNSRYKPFLEHVQRRRIKVKASSKFESRLARWVAAGLIDPGTAERIRAFEASDDSSNTRRWPIILALAIGGLLVAAGITLFVAAHWDKLSPAERFLLMILMVAVFHVGGAFASDRFPALATTAHAIGTAVLGAAIFLTAQIFNLRENWATGILLWAIGAAVGYLLLRDWPQAAFTALLVPAWLISQWTITIESHRGGERPMYVGLLLVCLTYLSARIGDEEGLARRTIVWIGGLAWLPCAGIAVAAAIEGSSYTYDKALVRIPTADLIVAWLVAIGGPLVLAWLLRGSAASINAAWALWSYLVILCASHTLEYLGDRVEDRFGIKLLLYLLLTLGAAGLIGWGLLEKRRERVNLGIAGFALTVLFFYFDSFMSKIGRSAGLLTLGILCLAGGYVLERARRSIVHRMESRP
jgi:uncharacterized membrane protein